jgi:ABC-2 type transport system permease protein
MVAAGLEVEGSIVFGLAWASAGLAFAAIAAVVAQVTTSARAATGLSAAILAGVYAVRAVGDAASEGGPRWLSWLSPIGWAQQFRPYAGNRWWVLGVTLGFAIVVGGAALALAARRDLGTGMLPTRAGPAEAAPSLRSPLALAWRLQRGALIGWSVAFLLLGALAGSIASSVGDFLNNPNAREFITKLGGEKGLIDAFLSVEFTFAGIFAAAFGIQAVMRLRTEEVGLRAEPVLATAVGRIRWALGHVLVAVAGATLLLALAGIAAGAVRAGQVGNAGELGRVFAGAMVTLPAAWVLAAIVVALFGLAPRFVVAGWVAFGFFILLGEIGPLVNLSQWVMDLSPFAHVPHLPGGPFSVVPVLALTLIAAALAGGGLAGLRRRDIG